MDQFPANEYPCGESSVIYLPRPPLQSIDWINVLDASSNEIGRIALAWNRCWPITRASINAVIIRFVAGYGDSAEDVPQAIRHGILIEIANLYENREDIVLGQAVELMPVSERLLWPYRAFKNIAI